MSEEQDVVANEARAQGWVPKEEFRGDENDWIDADTFVKRGKEINPILRKNNERIQRELDATKHQMEELRKATEEFKKFQKEAYENKLHAYEEEIQDLRALKKKAITDGDGDLVGELEDKIDELKEKKASAKPVEEDKKEPPVNPEVTQAIAEWVDKNKWYKEDVKMAAAANAVADTIRKTDPTLIGREFLDKVDAELLDLFGPEKLGKKTRPRSPVEGSSGPSDEGKPNKKSYENLPAEAKAACDKFTKQKLMTREDYVASYDWS